MSTHFNRYLSESSTIAATASSTTSKINEGSKPSPKEDQFNYQKVPPRSNDSDDDYEQRFAEDPMFEETGPNARVWRTYLVESAAFDENMVGEARDGLDSMLIFAGLFSSVVTSFLIQTFQNLQPPVVAMLLSEIATVQRATAGNILLPPSNITAILNLANPDTTNFGLWITGIWVFSLSLSLIVALASVLVKQWLYHYLSLPSGTSGERSRLRHYRYIGFQRWHVLTIIGSLPVIMHLSLALFFAGLFMFLRPVSPPNSQTLSNVIGSFTLFVYVLYLATNILPIFSPQCPYQTPLSAFLFKVRALILPSRSQSKATPGQSQPSSLKGSEGSAVRATYDSLSLQSLHWLYTMSSNPSVHSVVIQAIGGLPVSLKSEVGYLFSECAQDIERLLLKCTTDVPGSLSRQAMVGLETVTERICRTISFLSASSSLFNSFVWASPATFSGAVTFPTSNSPYFEASSLSMDLKKGIRSIQEYRAFISAHHLDLLHHPVVWNRLLYNALENDAFAKFSEHGGEEDAVFCLAILRAIWPYPSSPPSPDSLTMTMADAIHTHWRKEYVNYLRRKFLEMLLPFNHYSDDNTSDQRLVAAMEFALFHIAKTPNTLESSHWHIIDYIFAHHDFTATNPYFPSFVVRLIEKSNILVCETPLDSEYDIVLHRRATILHVYERTRMNSAQASNRLSNSGSEFALLPRAIERTFQSMQDLVDRPDSTMSEASSLLFVHALDVLSLALRNGVPDAYQIAMDYRCLELLHKVEAKRREINNHPHNIRFIDCYIAGLKRLTPALKEPGIDYLFHSTNLRLVVLISHTISAVDRDADDASQTSETATVSLNKLTQLRPDAQIWTACLHWLSRVMDWAVDVNNGSRRTEEDVRLRQIQNFVKERLGEEWLGTVLHLHMRLLELQPYRPSPFIRELQETIRWLEDFVQH